MLKINFPVLKRVCYIHIKLSHNLNTTSDGSVTNSLNGAPQTPF